MNPIAAQLNTALKKSHPALFDMMSEVGRNLFFPKGILTQSAEAKVKAHHINATVGIAKENDRIMYLPSVVDAVSGLTPEAALNYAPSYGVPELRQLWKDAIVQKNPSLTDKEISLPVVTSGITHGVSVFTDMWVDPGDTVVLPDMMWGNYNMIMAVRRGANIRQYPVFKENKGYNIEAFGKVLRDVASEQGKVVVVLNFPHNPTGYSPTVEEAEQIADLLTEVAENGTSVIVALDDSYFGLFYEPDTFKESLFTKLCDRHPRLLAVKLDGATKENYVWGLRVGFVTYGIKVEQDVAAIHDILERKTAGCVRGSVSNVSMLSQSLMVNSMQDPEYPAQKAEKYETLTHRAKQVKAVLEDPKYAEAWDVYPFNSGYFMCIRLKTVEAEALRVHLLDKHGVGLIALGEENLRVAFSCIEADQVQELFDTILLGVKEMEDAGA